MLALIGTVNLLPVVLILTDQSFSIKRKVLPYLYSNFFNRYCLFPVNNIEEVNTERAIDYLCYMFWDIFALCPENATSSMIDVALKVMSSALQYKNDYCIVSAIHGLGHWVLDVPRSSNILQNWLKTPTTFQEEIQERTSSYDRVYSLIDKSITVREEIDRSIN